MSVDNQQLDPSKSMDIGEQEGNEICPICGMASNPQSNIWIACDECQLWYHDVCEGLLQQKDGEPFVCTACRRKRKCLRLFDHYRKSPAPWKTPRH